jgi:hypothetical protein
MTTPEPIVQVTRFVVNCVPEKIMDADAWEIELKYYGDGRWVAHRHDKYLDVDGKWSWNRQVHNFDTALALAKKAAPDVVVNGYSVLDVIPKP